MLTAEARAKAVSPEARAKRRATIRARANDRRLDVVDARNWGLVPAAIADHLGISDVAVARYLHLAVKRGEVEPLPRWMTQKN